MHGSRAIFPLGLLPPGLPVLDAFFTLCCVEDLGEGFGCVDFARLFISCRKLQVSPFERCPLAFHCKHSLIPFLASKFFIRKVCPILSFYHCLLSVIIRSSFLLMNLHIVQFQYDLEFLRLSCSSFVQDFQDVIRWDLRHR